MQVGRIGGKVLVLTEFGENLLKHKSKSPFVDGNASHTLGIKEIIELVTPHFDEIQEEVRNPKSGKYTDILCKKGNITIAVEYETGQNTKKQINENYEKNNHWGHVIFVAHNIKVKKWLVGVLKKKRKCTILLLKR